MQKTESRTLLVPSDFEYSTFHGRDDAKLLEEIGRLRLNVWKESGARMEVHLDGDIWLDRTDDSSTHLALTHEGKVVAASRLTFYPSIAETPYPNWFTGITIQPNPPIAFISRLVVDTRYQRLGLGDFLDSKCEELARRERAGSVLCDVPEYRIDPLTRRGFQLINEPKLGIAFPDIKWGAMLRNL